MGIRNNEVVGYVEFRGIKFPVLRTPNLTPKVKMTKLNKLNRSYGFCSKCECGGYIYRHKNRKKYCKGCFYANKKM